MRLQHSRRTVKLLVSVGLVTGMAAVWSTPAAAVSLYWSGSGVTQGGPGSWGDAAPHFGTDSAGPFDVVWDNLLNAADTVIFGGLPGAVTLESDITVSTIRLNNNSSVSGTTTLSGGDVPLTILVGGAARSVGATIDAPISGANGLTASGTGGPLVLAGANTYGGIATFGAGNSAETSDLRLASASALPGSANLNLRNAIVGLTPESGDFIRFLGTGGSSVQWNGNGGFAAYGGDRSVTLGGGGTVSWNGTNSFVKTSTLLLGAADSDSTITFTNSLNLSGGNRKIQVNDGSAAIDAIISGQIGVANGSNGSLTKSGAGTLALTAASQLTGTVTINEGTLQIGDGITAGGFGRNPPIVVAAGATFAVGRPINASQSVNFGDISGAGGFAQVGTATTTLSSVNTYTGSTDVVAGTLVIAANDTVAASTSLRAAADGTVDVSGIAGGYLVPATQVITGGGRVAGSVGIAGAATVSPGDGPGTLGISQAVTFGAAGNYNWQLFDATGTAGSATGWDLLAIDGGLDITATAVEPFTVNLWTLSSTGPDVDGPAVNFDRTTATAWTIASATGGIQGFSADAFVVQTAAVNGTGGFANDFGGGGFSIAQSGNDLQLVFTPGSGPDAIVIDVPSGVQTQADAGYPTIDAALSVTKTGGGTLLFDSDNAYDGPTVVAAGTLALSTPAAVGSSAVTVASGATLAVSSGAAMQAPSLLLDGGTLTANTLAVADASGIGALTITSGTLTGALQTSVAAGGVMTLPADSRVTVAVGTLDVSETVGGGLVNLGSGEIAIAAGGISAADLRADIIAGRNGGAWTGATGITSSAASSSGGTRAVGYVVNGDGTARVSFAAAGDVDLSGAVNVFDLVSINSSGKYGAGTASVWSQGDFNYDGVTNVFDLVGVNTAGAYGQGNYFPSAPAAGGVAAVPEPTGGWAILALAAVAGRLAAARSRGR